jgi:hypothetical protein
MNGFIMRTVALACLGTGLAALAGCRVYDKFVDPCYPERYNAQARQAVEAPFAVQAANGHVLDQTVWNAHFEQGTDKLTIAGQEHLKHLARKRPHPDPRLWVQTAHDISYDQAAPEKFVNARTELDGKRAQAVERFLQGETAGRPVAWSVGVHDPAEVGMRGVPMQTSIAKHYANYQGLLPVQGTGPGITTGGPSGPSPR